MSKSLKRIAALLMIGCLVADPTFAIVFPNSAQNPTQSQFHNQSVLEKQALTLAIIWFRAALNKAATSSLYKRIPHQERTLGQHLTDDWYRAIVELPLKVLAPIRFVDLHVKQGLAPAWKYESEIALSWGVAAYLGVSMLGSGTDSSIGLAAAAFLVGHLITQGAINNLNTLSRYVGEKNPALQPFLNRWAPAHMTLETTTDADVLRRKAIAELRRQIRADFSHTIALPPVPLTRNDPFRPHEVDLMTIVAEDIHDVGQRAAFESAAKEAYQRFSETRRDFSLPSEVRYGTWLEPFTGQLKPQHFDRLVEHWPINEQLFEGVKLIREELLLMPSEPIEITFTTPASAPIVQAFLRRPDVAAMAHKENIVFKVDSVELDMTDGVYQGKIKPVSPVADVGASVYPPYCLVIGDDVMVNYKPGFGNRLLNVVTFSPKEIRSRIQEQILGLKEIIAALEQIREATLSAGTRHVKVPVALEDSPILKENGVDDLISRIQDGSLKLKGEIIDIIEVDENGVERIVASLDRQIAHEAGLLHRTANVLIKTPEGKFIILQRAHNMRQQPYRLTIPGGHVDQGDTYDETIIHEIRDELKLPDGWHPRGQLREIGEQGGFSSPSEDHKNRERRTLYEYHATDEEVAQIRAEAARLKDAKTTRTQAEFEAWLVEQQARPGSGETYAILEISAEELVGLGSANQLPDTIYDFKDGPKNLATQLTSDLLGPLLHDVTVQSYIQTSTQGGIESPRSLARHIQTIMGLPENQRVVLIVNTAFKDSFRATLGFLNSGRSNIVALKGPAGVFDEFYFDGHPKAVNVPDKILREAGFDVPDDGIIDPMDWSSVQRETALPEHKTRILDLKSRLEIPLAEVEEFEQRKFASLKTAEYDRRKVKISDELSIYANAHIFDLVVQDKLGRTRTIRTYQNSPVISEGVKIISVGPETLKNWGAIISGSGGVIVVGDVSPFQEAVLTKPTVTQDKILVDASDQSSMEILSNATTWKSSPSLHMTWWENDVRKFLGLFTRNPSAWLVNAIVSGTEPGMLIVARAFSVSTGFDLILAPASAVGFGAAHTGHSNLFKAFAAGWGLGVILLSQNGYLHSWESYLAVALAQFLVNTILLNQQKILESHAIETAVLFLKAA